MIDPRVSDYIIGHVISIMHFGAVFEKNVTRYLFELWYILTIYVWPYINWKIHIAVHYQNSSYIYWFPKSCGNTLVLIPFYPNAAFVYIQISRGPLRLLWFHHAFASVCGPKIPLKMNKNLSLYIHEATERYSNLYKKTY